MARIHAETMAAVGIAVTDRLELKIEKNGTPWFELHPTC